MLLGGLLVPAGHLEDELLGTGSAGRGSEPGRGLCEQRPGGDRRACMGWQDWEGWGVAAAAVHWLRVSAGASHPLAFRAGGALRPSCLAGPLNALQLCPPQRF